MEFGKSAHYKTERDRLRFVHYNNVNEWETLAESASALPDDEKEAYNKFCQARAQDSVIDRSDTGIVVRGGSYDKAARTASVQFIRPFDVHADYTLTLKAGETYKLWMNWGMFRGDNDYALSMVHGDEDEASGQDWTILTPPNNPELASGATALIAGSLAAGLMLLY